MRTKLTPAFCQRATVQQAAERTIYWDTDLPGFGLLVTKSAHRCFVVQYRAGETKSSSAPHNSLGWPTARRAARCSTISRYGEPSGVRLRPATDAVIPGAMQLTVILSGPSSRASVVVSPTMASLVMP